VQAYQGPSGGGAGGSIWISTPQLIGSGSLTANGGNGPVVGDRDGGGGSGGRIAVYYATNEFSGRIEVFGGSGFVPGGAGTSFLKSVTQPRGTLLVDNHGLGGALTPWSFTDAFDEVRLSGQGRVSITGTNLWRAGQVDLLEGTRLELDDGASLATDRLLVSSNATILCRGWNVGVRVAGAWAGRGVTITADTLTLERGGSISGDGQGYTGTSTTGNGPGGGSGGEGGGGGGHGGNGGNSQMGTSGGTAYGSITQPTDLGSAGGAGSGAAGGAGGGAIRLVVSNTFRLEGTVAADGASGLVQPYRGISGGGAGGSIWIETTLLMGSGSLRANGGNRPAIGSTDDGGGGAGGRIAVHATTNLFAGTFSARGGAGYVPGGAGTLYLRDEQQAAARLVLDNGGRTGAPEAALSVSPGELDELSLAGGVRLDLRLAEGVQLRGVQLSDSELTLAGELRVANDVQLRGTSKLTHGAGDTNGLRVIAGRQLLVETNASIDVSGKGLLPTTEVSGESGGSYGGPGVNWSGQSNPIFGDERIPLDLGIGGASTAGQACRGGGLVWIDTPELLVAGRIVANGQNDVAATGGGSGGSILINTARLPGGGGLEANGGNGYSSGTASGSGGGGRIAIHLWGGMELSLTNVTAAGGAANPGGTGTVYVGRAPLFAWGDEETLLHETARFPVMVLGADSLNTRLDLTAASADALFVLLSGGPAWTPALWDTSTAMDGGYQVTAVFRDASGVVLGNLAREVRINNSAAWHAGTIIGEVEWASNRVHLVDGEVVIGPGSRLTVAPGAVIKFVRGGKITIADGATLNALGTAQAGIVFTSLADDTAGDDTNLDGRRSIPQPGDWNGLVARGSGQLVLNEFVELRYVGSEHQGTLAANEVWRSTSLHRIRDHVTVPAGGTLTIQPGAILKFDLGKQLNALAGSRLLAQGTLAEPITFTSMQDDSAAGDTNGDGTRTSPAAGDWGWIFLQDASGVFDHCLFRYGGGPVPGGWGPPADPFNTKGLLKTTGGSASLSVSNSTLLDAFYDGVLAWGGNVALVNCVLSGIDRAVSAHPGSPVRVVNCTLDRNRLGLLVHGGSLTAENTVVANSSESGVQYDFGTLTAVRYCNVWAPPAAGYANYRNTPDPTGQNGNRAVDPQFKDRAGGNYRLAYGSPCIDAADGTVAPPTDQMGAPRYTDFRTPNTGITNAAGVYADLGAFEFVEAAHSEIDLIVSGVQGPGVAVAGEVARLTWTIANLGSQAAVGPWHDDVSLVQEVGGQQFIIPAGEVLVGQGVTLGPGQTYLAAGEVRVPGSVAGPHRWRVWVNSRDEVFEGLNQTNNAGLSLGPVALDLPALGLGTPWRGQFTAAGQYYWFKLQPGAGRDVLVQLDLQAAQGATELYLGRGYMPTPWRFEASHQEWNRPDVTALLASTTEETYYGLVYARTLPAGPAEFTLSLLEQQFSLTSVDPTTVGNSGQVTLQLRGGQLTDRMQYELVDALGTTHVAPSVFVRNSAVVYATFKLTNAPLGLCHVQVDSLGQIQRLTNALTLVAAQAPPVEFKLTMPRAVRAGDWTAATIQYANPGNVDALAPLRMVVSWGGQLSVTNPDGTKAVLVGFFAGTVKHSTKDPEPRPEESMLLLFLAQDGPAGILRPGTLHFRTIYFRAYVGSPVMGLAIAALDELTPLDWAQEKAAMKPDYVTPEAWDTVFANFTTRVGSTFQQCQQALADTVNYLSQFWVPKAGARRTTVVGQVPGREGGSVQDASVSLGTALNAIDPEYYRPGRWLAYLLNLSGLHTIGPRYALGAFGRGRPASWDIQFASTETNVTFAYSGRPIRVFEGWPPSYLEGFRGGAGDFGRLEAVGPDLGLHESDGRLLVFYRTNGVLTGKLKYVQDLNGTRDTFVYDGTGRVERIENTNGDTFQIDYNPQGRVARITDPVGRVTTYSYDVAGEHLLAVSDPEGTTRFNYVTGQGAAREHAVASVSATNGSRLVLEYDEQGRLTRQALEDGTGETRWQYGPLGRVTGTDALGNSIVTDLDHESRLRRRIDGLGQVFRYDFDAAGYLAQSRGPDGATRAYRYDDRGRLTQSTDPLGHTSQAGYQDDYYARLLSQNRSYDRPIWLTEPTGNFTRFSYDAAANLVTRRFADGQTIRYAYDPQGNLIQRVNARGQTNTLAYDAKGLLTNEVNAAGHQIHFAYDARRNLRQVTEPGRTTTFACDDADRLIRVGYSNGRFLEFEYDALGRRVRASDQDAFVLRYEYDTAGRLARLTDGQTNLLVRYTRDAAGRLSRKDLGNGASTTYAYDAASHLTSLVNLSPSNSVLSRFDYGYGLQGFPVTMTTPEGVWRCQYDAAGQLTKVITPAGRELAYQYDPAGNRLRATNDGLATDYSTNPRDQYTAAGAARFGHDADGNLVRTELGVDTWLYTYGDLNRLIEVVTPQGRWAYEYDALGQRVATVRDGQRSEFLVDPTGRGDPVAVYDGAGQLVRRYVHGLGLVCAIEASAQTAWYQFDAAGNTTDLTDASGSVLNRYVYLPFGERLSAVETVENPFQFVGEFGVMQDGHGLHFMRARYYEPGLGRFVQPDPVGEAAGLNLYAYAKNTPLALVDPSGLQELPGDRPVSWYRHQEAQNIIPGGTWKTRVEPTRPWAGSVVVPRTPGQREREDLDWEATRWETFAALLGVVEQGLGYVPGYGSIYSLESAGVQFIRGEWGDALWRLPDAIPLMKCIRGGKKGVQIVAQVGKFTGDKRLDDVYSLTVDTAGVLNAQFDSPNIQATGHSQVVGSVDPNSIQGPAGYGAEHWIAGDVVLPYTVFFENVRTATAPAQVVVITNQLSDKLDWATFELGPFGFGPWVFEVPPRQTFFRVLLALGAQLGVDVYFAADLNQDTGLVTWRFESADPFTRLLPEDPFAGFLPPNTNAPTGQGFVSYLARARTNTATGDRLEAQAGITFDVNPPLATPRVFNTLDRTLPASQVLSLPAKSASWFTVFWTGQDNAGLGYFDLFVSRDGGPYTNWLSATPATSATFLGQVGSTYAFYSVATDAVGHREAPPSQPDAWTRVVAAAAPRITGAVLSHAVFGLMVEDLAPGTRYAVERSPTLRADDWQSVREFTATSSTTEQTVPVLPDWPAMFFRLRIL
jgi:RHS repeat-associated protein